MTWRDAHASSTELQTAKFPVDVGSGKFATLPDIMAFAVQASQPGAAGQGFNYRGVWTPATVYAAYDVITYGGQTYAAIAAFTSSSVFDASRFWLMAAKGADGLAGTPGTQGTPGIPGAAGIGFTFRGAWIAQTSYAVNDVLTYGGQTYLVTTAFTAGSSFDATKLALWAAKGADGAPGSSSPAASSTVAGVTVDGNTIPATTSNPYQMATADRVVDVNKGTGAATKLLLPTAPTLWVEYTIIDGKGDAATNNITITAASGTTINGQASLVIDGNNLSRSLRAVNATTWRIT